MPMTLQQLIQSLMPDERVETDTLNVMLNMLSIVDAIKAAGLKAEAFKSHDVDLTEWVQFLTANPHRAAQALATALSLLAVHEVEQERHA